MKLIVCIGLLISLFSCEAQSDKKALENIFYQATVDTDVVKKLYLYDSLRNIIISNIDTIFKFKNKTHFVFYADKKESIREDDYSYRFNYYPDDVKRLHGTVEEARGADPNSLNKMPAFIYPFVEKIFKKIGSDKINGFTITEDSIILINIKSDYHPKEHVYVNHSLKWGRDYKNGTDVKNLVYDTLLAPNWVYTFLVNDYN